MVTLRRMGWRQMSNQIPPHLAGFELQPQLQGLPERPDVEQNVQKQLTVCLVRHMNLCSRCKGRHDGYLFKLRWDARDQS
jgi:hypothetical protein